MTSTKLVSRAVTMAMMTAMITAACECKKSARTKTIVGSTTETRCKTRSVRMVFSAAVATFQESLRNGVSELWTVALSRT